MKRIQKVFSFSNVVAVIALFVALGGSVYAASSKARIDGGKIRPKSIPGNRIKASSLTGAQLKARTLTGAKIKPGSLTGKQIVGSSLSGVSASSLASVQYAVTTIPLVPWDPISTVASCGPGEKVIGGGAVVSNDNFASVNDSGPQVSRNGWEATASAWLNGATMTVTAICTAVGSASGSERTEPRPLIRYEVP